MSGLQLDKVVHFFMFGILLFVFNIPKLNCVNFKGWLIISIIFVIIWGITTELIQKYFVKNREFDIFDFLADILGTITFGYIINKIHDKFTIENK